MIQEIVQHINATIETQAQKFSTRHSFTQKTSPEEIKALFGVLIYSGQRRDNHLSTDEMWSNVSCAPVYRAALSEHRFCFLHRCLRFDYATTRRERAQNDKLGPIRTLWDAFAEKCKVSYNPGSESTIDEQLLAFRGRCGFRMYIPSKPAKYGINIMMCDNESKYMFDAIPYLGKQTSNAAPRNLGLAHYLTMNLSSGYFNTGINITTDNWFTSIPLTEDLLAHGLTTVGTLRANKKEIPPDMKDQTDREIGTTAFCFSKDLTMMSYYKKKNKNIYLLSSVHSTPTIDEGSGRPEVISYYNKTKGGVDSFDQMSSL